MPSRIVRVETPISRSRNTSPAMISSIAITNRIAISGEMLNDDELADEQRDDHEAHRERAAHAEPDRPVDEVDARPERGRFGAQQLTLLLAFRLRDAPLDHARAIDDASEPRRQHAEQSRDAGDEEHGRDRELDHSRDGLDRGDGFHAWFRVEVADSMSLRVRVDKRGAYRSRRLLLSNPDDDLPADTRRRDRRAPRRDRERAARARARGQRHRRLGAARGVRDRRAHGLSAAAARGRAAGDHGRGRGDPALRGARRREGRAARRGHVAVGRRDPRGRRDRRGSRQVQPHSRRRLREPLRRRAIGRHESRDQPRGRGRRVLLRARSVEPDRVHDRRQRRRELGRRALPEVRPHDEQRARDRARDAATARSCGSAASISTAGTTICSASWSARKDCSASSPR